uniref:Uncharacterized protein n=1 Tax=Arion vulgaris TaxID=1028688 RepID=A0A0B7BMK0_9EUPU
MDQNYILIPFREFMQIQEFESCEFHALTRLREMVPALVQHDKNDIGVCKKSIN